MIIEENTHSNALEICREAFGLITTIQTHGTKLVVHHFERADKFEHDSPETCEGGQGGARE